jgi:hypothetical protein
MNIRKYKFVLFIVIMVSGLFAHPADDINTNFDPIKSVLTVTAIHTVKDVDDHFIEEISIKLNKKEIITQTFKTQTDLKEATALYKIIDAKAGDTITVTTKCNQFGKKTDKILVPAIQTDEE